MKKNRMKKRIQAVILGAALAVTGIFAISSRNSAADSSGVVRSSWAQTTGGLSSENLGKHEYNHNWADVVRSYVTEDKDGTLERVEAGEDGVYVETYDASLQVTASRKIENALPLFGGYFRGENYKFLVFGQVNLSENKYVEIMRVLKYDMFWNYVGQQSVKGANTTAPFEAGSLRMAEENGILYIHTCHQMYTTSDGLRHQANMTFAFDEETLEIKKQQYGIAYVLTGYVSHSFNQFIVADGGKLYRLDHGDAYPRCVCLLKDDDYLAGNNIASGASVLNIAGSLGQNATGVCVGGFGKQKEWLITVGNSVKQNKDNYNTDDQRNIFVTLVTDADLTVQDRVWLTQYGSGDNVTVGNPYLVDATDGYYVLWEEKTKVQKKSTTVTKIVKMNTAGETTEGPYTLRVRLSDCQPIITSNNRMVWYVTNKTEPLFYSLDLKQLSVYDNVEMGSEAMVDPTASVKPSPTVSPKPSPSKETKKKTAVSSKPMLSKPARAVIKKITVHKRGAACIQLRIKKVPKASYYEVEYSLNRNFEKKHTRTTFRTKVDYILRRNKKYYFRVRAVREGNSTTDYEDLKGSWSKVKKLNTKR